MGKLPNHILLKLQAARKAATLEDASFGFPNDTVTAKHHFEPEVTTHPTDYIKDRVSLHHDSWIIGPLDEIIAWATKADEEAL